ncbi:MAG: hypothetical protein ABSA85_16840 [Terracidiphilus sp.]
MNSTANAVKMAKVIAKLAVGISVTATMVSGTPGLAQRTGKGEQNTPTITLRVYDYSHVGQKALRAAEGDAARILAQAGVIAHWTDCPTRHADVEKYPGCTGAATGTEYMLLLLSSSMTAVQEKSQDALGNASDCGRGACIARVYYDRIEKLAGGDSVPSYVLAGRVMAREVGQLLIGVMYRSRSGIMSASWTHQQLGLLASPEIVFSSAEASAMKARLAEREQAAAMHLAETDTGQLKQPR